MKFKVTILIACFVLIATTSVNGRNQKFHTTKVGKHDQPQDLNRDQVSSLFESYDKSMSNKQMKARLDALALYLKQNPSFRAYIISYAGRRSCHAEAPMRAKLAKNYLFRVNGTDESRITTIDGGYRVEWTVELWIGANGALAPTPMPTVERHEVRMTRKCKPTGAKDRIS